MIRARALTSVVIAALALSLPAVAKSPEKDIVDTAVGAGQFKTLAKLVTAAGLVDALKGSGPFTVFAPTDAAFAKVPKATLDALAKDKAALTQVLLYHVVSGKVESGTALKLKKADTLAKAPLKLKVKGGHLFINQAKVVKADVMASNGVIHVIDSVLLPPAAGKKHDHSKGDKHDH